MVQKSQAESDSPAMSSNPGTEKDSYDTEHKF